jgi:RNA polymerase sigma-70 factor (ECF subfamily)
MSDAVFEDVLLAAQAGDENAFAQLWRTLNPPVVRYLRTLAPSSASDLASETWVQVIRNLSKFSGGEPAFRAWVFTIARNKVVDAARHDRRRPQSSIDEAALDRLASPDDTAQLAMDNLSTDAALALIASLPRDQAEVIMLRVVAGLDAAAVGVILGKSAGAVRVTAHRGLRCLQELVGRPPVSMSARQEGAQ